MKTTYSKYLCISFLVSFLVYLYNIIRFPIFNNDFDPWFHVSSISGILGSDTLDLNAYNGFPGLYIVVIYLSKNLDIDVVNLVKWLPLFSGVLSSIVMVLVLRYVIRNQSLSTPNGQIPEEIANSIVLLGCLINTTLSLFSLVSSGMFWGQMLTASLVPVILIKFLEVNTRVENHVLLEFFLVTIALFFIHHLTSFLLITFLSFTQLYLLLIKKGSIKGTLITFISVLLFMIRYETLSLNISIVSSLTQGKTNYFYVYFLALFVAFVVLIILKKIKAKLGTKVALARATRLIKKATSTLVIMIVVGIGLSILFLSYIMPYVLSIFASLSPSWFLFYGSNLLLFAPLAIAGVIIFGKLFNTTLFKLILYCWFGTILFVLVLLFGLFFLHLGVGALEYGRLTTFFYPMMSIFAAFTPVLLIQRGNGRVPLKPHKIAPILKKAKSITRVAVIASFCILTPFSIIGFNPPPSATLTQYWNTPSEQATIMWIAQGARNDTRVNVDYHLYEMMRCYESIEGRDLAVGSSYFLYFLQQPPSRSQLLPGHNYLVLIDDVMLSSSLSYSSATVEHGVLPPLGDGQLAIYDNLTILNRIYCTDSQWLYQCYLDN